jgi:RND family efflux transporter MFP subunit
VLERARAELARAEAELRLAEAHLRRSRALRDGGAISEEEIAKVHADLERARAAVAIDRLAVERAKLDLDFTRITAPIDGTIGRSLVSVGNVVGPDAGPSLAAVVSTDPIYVSFDVPEGHLPAVRRLMAQDSPPAPRLPVQVQVVGGGDFTLRGILNYLDSEVSPRTGTVQVRAALPNRDGALLPGQFARVRLPLVPEK